MNGARTRVLVVCTVAIASAVLCGCQAAAATTSPSPSQASTAAPAPNPTLAFAPIKGTATCTFVVLDDKTVGGAEVLSERFSCVNDTNDERVNGTVDLDITTTIEPADAPTMRWELTAKIQNAGGTWTGTGRGAVVMWGDTSGPTNYGIDVYTGSGGYAGLTYHEFVAGSDDLMNISGWIEGR